MPMTSYTGGGLGDRSPSGGSSMVPLCNLRFTSFNCRQLGSGHSRQSAACNCQPAAAPESVCGRQYLAMQVQHLLVAASADGGGYDNLQSVSAQKALHAVREQCAGQWLNRTSWAQLTCIPLLSTTLSGNKTMAFAVASCSSACAHRVLRRFTGGAAVTTAAASCPTAAAPASVNGPHTWRPIAHSRTQQGLREARLPIGGSGDLTPTKRAAAGVNSVGGAER